MKFIYKKFNLLVLSAILCLILSTSLINVIVDPYDIYPFVSISGFNKVKIYRLEFERLFKAYTIKRIKPEVLFMGTSRVLDGINPDKYTELTGKSAYNLAFCGANMYEIKNYLESAIKFNKNIEEVYLGLDLISFTEYSEKKGEFDEARLKTHFYTIKDFFDTTISWEALNKSFKTIDRNKKNQEEYIYRANGWYATQGTNTANFVNISPDEVPKNMSEVKFDNFIKIIELTKQNNIKLTLFVNPVHTLALNKYKEFGALKTYIEWKKRLAQITPFYDFSGINPITTEEISKDMDYQDASHYKSKVGDYIMNYILNKPSINDFGILVNTSNIDNHLNEFEQEFNLHYKVKK